MQPSQSTTWKQKNKQEKYKAMKLKNKKHATNRPLHVHYVSRKPTTFLFFNNSDKS